MLQLLPPNNPKDRMRISIWSGLCLVMVFAACQNDSKDTNYEELILGRWEIKEAQRNGRPTETLTGAFMEFLPKGRMISNVGGAPEESDYSVEGMSLPPIASACPPIFRSSMQATLPWSSNL
ncbi:MAG: hypothetical protein IPJ40_12660 [Saprospirales bacterium]|nr:hypothetical protein [Saprospirales bacterium]